MNELKDGGWGGKDLGGVEEMNLSKIYEILKRINKKHC